jgi:hypothetical protein
MFRLAALMLTVALSVGLVLTRPSVVLAHAGRMMLVVSGARIMLVAPLVVSGARRRSARVPVTVTRATAMLVLVTARCRWVMLLAY